MAVDVYFKHRLVLRVLGIGLPGENGSCLQIILQGMFVFLSVLFPTLVVCFLLGSVTYKEYSVTARVYSITGVISSTSAFLKLQILYRNKISIKEIMDLTNGYKAETFIGRMTYKLTILYEILTLSYRMISVIEAIVKRQTKLLMPFWTPFEVPETVGASIAMYTFFQLSVMLKTLSNFPVDTLFLHMANQICQRLHVVKNSMEMLGLDEDDKTKHLKANKILPFEQKLTDVEILNLCIKEHQEIIRLIALLSKILDQFFVPLAFNSFTSILFAFFLVSQSEDKFKEILKIAPWTTVIFFQIFIACWAGELIKKKCFDIRFAAYNNSWYQSSITLRKDLAFVQNFTSKPVILRGAYVFELSLHTYETAVREVFSTFTVMYQLFNQKES